uniref:A disintegrin and metalloproteinase with thrombospondin motifs 12-like n=1 Tax=Sinocyclocheilus rhinocerous TaxID=307959 RepID=A0A673HYV7_9TELE
LVPNNVLLQKDSCFQRRIVLFSFLELFIKQHSEFYVDHPEKVDGDGNFISYSLSHHFSDRRHKRDLNSEERRVYYKLNYKGQDFTLSLTTNDNLLTNEYVLEKHNGSLTEKQSQTFGSGACHLIGTVTDGYVQGTAAISTCEGLSLWGQRSDMLDVLKILNKMILHQKNSHLSISGADGSEFSQQVEQEREHWEQEQHQISPRSISKERWVETMVVGDSKLVDYHGSGNVESYIFTIMNMVAGIFHDASIGNAIHIVLVRLILLHGEEKGLKIIHHADTTLNSFCTWQKNLNPQSDTHPAHHDVAILITRKDICAGMNQPCETLGLSHLSGLCQPHRSCNINEDSGLPVAFTIAHELGHSFGIHHDGQGNDCELVGRHPFIMSRQLHYDSSPLTWSSCSKEYITRFLDRGWGFCLDDRPSKRDLSSPMAAPGVRYTPQHQCQLQYGPNATFCSEVENVCQILWCSVNGSCRSKLDSPIDGTRCGPEKWCISGECVIVGKLPETVHGGWGPWSTWSHCSRTCGAGVQSADRECNQPKPEFGGKYCTGERKRYRICSTKPCARKHPSFREMQCSEFNTVPYHNELYEWIPVASSSRPCELHCKPVDENFSEKMLDAVTDGTPCFMNNSRNSCVNGVCKEVGCDFGINSNAKEDGCGVCLGDGSTCETVKENFVAQDGFGYTDLVLIPEGARDIFIQEVEEAGNFLAIRAADSDEYYLNGNYIIQWNGEYEAGGTKFYYDRTGNMENLTSAGPTTEPVMIQLLFQEANPGVKYEYTIKRSRPLGNEILEPEYIWKYGAWTDCSTTCGLGEQHQPVRCFEPEVGVVEETLCDPSTRPDDRHRKCKNMDCPARWWVGGWQTCSATCGPDGVRKRTILCVRTVAGEERVLHPGDCKQLLKPKPVVPCNRDVPCGFQWTVGNWSECSLSCDGGIKSRFVKCVAKQPGRCNPANRPRSTILCNLQSCSSTNRWTGSPFRPRFPPKIPTDDHKGSDGPVTVPTNTEDEEGSADLRPPDKIYTPGYDYIVEDPTGEERAREDNMFTSTTEEVPTSTVQSLHTNISTTKPDTTRRTQYSDYLTTSPVLQKTRSSYEPHTTTNPTVPHLNTQSPQATCSTTCGLGAVWRSVACSSEREEDCASVKKPEPARRCNLRPCATWKSGNWSECPEGCVTDMKHREVQCIDTQSRRLLRPFHCQALSYKPHSSLPCNTRPCLQWMSSPWAECSKSCGRGVKERRVYCPEYQRCNVTLKPNSTESCNLQPCTSWATEAWGQCSRRCGGGVQKRAVWCRNEESGEEEKMSLCAKNNKPDSVQNCNPEECLVCKKNSMSTRFCEKLKLLGRCSLRSIRKQCCVTCMM